MAANLKEVRNRIKSVVSTQQITKAMKMVSAAKLRKAQTAIQQLRPYANRLNKALSNILSSGDGGSGSLGKTTQSQKPLLIIITSDRGLCGGFNSNIIKLANATIKEKYAHQLASGNLGFLCIGKKGFEFFRRRYPKTHFITDYQLLYSHSSFEKIADLADRLMKDFRNGTYDQMELYYGRFKNAGTQFPECEQYLPVAKQSEKKTTAGMSPDYIFEPNQHKVLEELIPSILQTQLYKCLIDTQASEHGARMTAMDKATENAEEMLGELRINYNKARQEAITKELSEIVGGAAALEG